MAGDLYHDAGSAAEATLPSLAPSLCELLWLLPKPNQLMAKYTVLGSREFLFSFWCTRCRAARELCEETALAPLNLRRHSPLLIIRNIPGRFLLGINGPRGPPFPSGL